MCIMYACNLANPAVTQAYRVAATDILQPVLEMERQMKAIKLLGTTAITALLLELPHPAYADQHVDAERTKEPEKVPELAVLRRLSVS